MPEQNPTSTSQPILLSRQLDKPMFYDQICTELKRLINAGNYQACFNQTLELIRQYPKADLFRLYLAISAWRLDKNDIAITALLTLLREQPEHVEALTELGLLYHRLNRYDEALKHLEAAFKLNNNALLAMNLSIIYYEYGQFDKAIYYCDQVGLLDKQGTLKYGPALIQLAQGNYQQGWQSYEYRLKKEGTHLIPLNLPTPAWDGTANLAGKTLLLTWEQGFGDNIQFIRFVKKLHDYQPVAIHLLCPTAIAPLFAQFKDIQIHSYDNLKTLKPPEHDFHISLPSLPFVLHINEESQFLTEPYLHADDTKLAQLKNKAYQGGWLHIGFCWRGNKNHTFNDWRSCGLDFFIPLLAYEKVRWYSLQKETDVEELQLLYYSDIPNLGATFQDFSDTAAAIALLDVIITVDTAVAHLAGAMGKPVWLLARYQTEWRHPPGRDISPWYPSMRIMRQSKPGDWDSVLHQVEAALESQYHLTKIEGT